MAQTVTGIPAEQVGNVVQDFIDDGAKHIVIEETEDGNYTVSSS